MATKKKKRVGVRSGTAVHTSAKKTVKAPTLKSSSLEADLAEAIRGGDGVVEALWFSSESVIGHATRFCSTRSLALDGILKTPGGFGFAFGRIVEVSGKEQSGKTTLAQQIAAETQAMGGVVALYDTEEKWDQIYAKHTGVDVDKCLSIQPVHKAASPDEEDAPLKTKKEQAKANKKEKSEGSKTIEQGIAAIDRALQMWIRKGHTAPLTIIWDSIAATPTAEELADLTDKQPGVAARELRRAMRVLTSKVARAGCLLVLVNQTYEKINSFGFGPKSTTYGGGAIRYHATHRVELVRTGYLKHTDGTIVGIEGVAKLVKNSLGAQAEVPYAIAHGRGFDNAWSLVEKLKEAKYITVRPGGNYVFAVQGEPPVTWRGGFAQLDVMMRADPQLASRLITIYKALP